MDNQTDLYLFLEQCTTNLLSHQQIEMKLQKFRNQPQFMYWLMNFSETNQLAVILLKNEIKFINDDIILEDILKHFMLLTDNLSVEIIYIICKKIKTIPNFLQQQIQLAPNFYLVKKLLLEPHLSQELYTFIFTNLENLYQLDQNQGIEILTILENYTLNEYFLEKNLNLLDFNIQSLKFILILLVKFQNLILRHTSSLILFSTKFLTLNFEICGQIIFEIFTNKNYNQIIEESLTNQQKEDIYVQICSNLFDLQEPFINKWNYTNYAIKGLSQFISESYYIQTKFKHELLQFVIQQFPVVQDQTKFQISLFLLSSFDLSSEEYTPIISALVQQLNTQLCEDSIFAVINFLITLSEDHQFVDQDILSVINFLLTNQSNEQVTVALLQLLQQIYQTSSFSYIFTHFAQLLNNITGNYSKSTIVITEITKLCGLLVTIDQQNIICESFIKMINYFINFEELNFFICRRDSIPDHSIQTYETGFQLLSQGIMSGNEQIISSTYSLLNHITPVLLQSLKTETFDYWLAEQVFQFLEILSQIDVLFHDKLPNYLELLVLGTSIQSQIQQYCFLVLADFAHYINVALIYQLFNSVCFQLEDDIKQNSNIEMSYFLQKSIEFCDISGKQSSLAALCSEVINDFSFREGIQENMVVLLLKIGLVQNIKDIFQDCFENLILIAAEIDNEWEWIFVECFRLFIAYQMGENVIFKQHLKIAVEGIQNKDIRNEQLLYYVNSIE